MTDLVDAPRPVRPAHPRAHRRSTPRTSVVLVAWAAVLVAARVWGLWIVHHTTANLFLGAVPLFGRWHWLWTGRLLAPIAVAAGTIILLPRVAQQWPWRRVLVGVFAATVLFGLALTFTDHGRGWWTSIETEYGQHTALVEQVGPGAFLRDYIDHQPTFPTHLQAHPPAFVLLLWAADRVGISGDGFELALALGGAAAAAMSALIALRDVAGDELARRAAPFVVIAPAAVWHANPDSFFAGVAMTAVALVVVATGRTDRRGTLLALAGGVLFGASLLLSYGLALLAIPMLAVAVWRRRVAPLLVAACAALAVVLLPAAWGFAWLAGLRATKHQYDINLALVRPYSYFVFANLAVVLLAVGPAVAVGLSRLRDRAARVLIGGGLAVVLAADLSGLSSAEVERIWQPFFPLLLLAGALVAVDHRSTRRWLTAQATVTIVLQAALRSPW